MKSRPKLLLIDADIVVFQFAHVHEVTYEWEDDVVSRVKDYEAATQAIDEFYKDLLERTKTSKGLFCFSSKDPNFRYDVLPTYKHNRSKERPELVGELRQYIEETYETIERPSLEADDVMGILTTISPGKYIIASIDKDLAQIPGYLYNWRTDELQEISEDEADYFFYKQVLTGDATDGYSGCPGIGPVKAERLLDSLEIDDDPWEAIVDAYESKGLTKDDALQQARVARILRKDDYDFKRKRPRLWTP